jgi:hypothetical protein
MTRHVEPESCPWPPIGNRVDPQASADAMKARFAEMEQEAPLARPKGPARPSCRAFHDQSH